MKNSRKNVAIVGGGLPGLFSALLISERYPGLDVHLIERDRKLGGLYNSFHDEQADWFDHGMHLIYESCVEEVDRQIRETMDEKDWIILNGNHKDIAGVFFNGVLHEDSPYIDIRGLPQDIQRECVADLFLHLSDQNPRAMPDKTVRPLHTVSPIVMIRTLFQRSASQPSGMPMKL